MVGPKEVTHTNLLRQQYIVEHAPNLAGQIANGVAASGRLVDPKQVAEAAILCAGELYDQMVVKG